MKVVKISLNPITGLPMVLGDFRKNNLNIALHHLGEESKQLHCVHSRVRRSGRGQWLSWVPGVQLRAILSSSQWWHLWGSCNTCRAQRFLPPDLLSQHNRWLCKHSSQVRCLQSFLEKFFQDVSTTIWTEKILGSHFHCSQEMVPVVGWKMKVKSCPTLYDPMDCSLPGSSVHSIFQAIVLEWIAISFSSRSSRPRDRTQVYRIVDRRFTVWASRDLHLYNQELPLHLGQNSEN